MGKRISGIFGKRKGLYLFMVIMVSILLFGGAPIALSDTLGTLEISWDANKESDLARYKVYAGNATGQYGEPVTIEDFATTCLIPDIDKTIGWYIAVTAVDTSGNESGFSDEVYIDDIPPAKVKGVRAIFLKIISWFRKVLGVRAAWV